MLCAAAATTAAACSAQLERAVREAEVSLLGEEAQQRDGISILMEFQAKVLNLF